MKFYKQEDFNTWNFWKLPPPSLMWYWWWWW